MQIFTPTGTPVPVTGAGTAQKIFQSSIAGVGAYTLNALGSLRLQGKRFGVRASGNAIGPTAATTLQLQLLGNVPGQAAVILAQSTARTMATNAFGLWTIEAELTADGYQVLLATGNFSGTEIGSNQLSGRFEDVIYTSTGPIIDAPAVLTNSITANLNMNAEPPLQFNVAVLFGTSNANNIANLFEFYGYAND